MIPPQITEQEIAKGLSGNRYNFEVAFSPEPENVFSIVVEQFRRWWQDAIIIDSESEHLSWFLKSQQGHIEADKTTIYFDDNDLAFAARFALWCRTLLSGDIKLIARSSPYRKPPKQLQIELNQNTDEQVLFGLIRDVLSE